MSVKEKGFSTKPQIFAEVCPDITITRARYAELLIAESDANRLKDIIHERAGKFQGMNFEEIKLIDKVFSAESEETTDD